MFRKHHKTDIVPLAGANLLAVQEVKSQYMVLLGHYHCMRPDAKRRTCICGNFFGFAIYPEEA
jgi:hypothetical protein